MGWSSGGASSITVWGTTLERILEDNGAPSIINVVSIDVEVGEVPIVEQMCRLRSYRFVCGCIERNGRQQDYRLITRLLRESGHRVVWEGQMQHDLLFVSEEGLANGG